MKRKLVALFMVWLVAAAQIAVPGAARAEETRGKPLQGKYLSVIGDSISTYKGWSDSRPITAEGCAYRYGEPYYGPVGSDCHNTELLVQDTWWHQAAQELGAQILVSNAGNSTGVLYASYPQNLGWQQYLQDMLVYKTRPYFLGADGKQPDLVALYIGSADVGKGIISEFGSIDAIDFDELIVPNGDGTYTYAVPKTVAEGYSIMLHKIRSTYPNAEIYCFTVVPNSGGDLKVCNRRLKATYPFNEMLKGVAEYFDATIVDLFDAFDLDPDGDGLAVQKDLDTFKSYFNGDPHPNAQGFDVITRCFVDAVVKNSRWIDSVQVETTGGNFEEVIVNVSEEDGAVFKTAENERTASGMLVSYQEVRQQDGSSTSSYSANNPYGVYWAKGGSSETPETRVPAAELEIPLICEDDPKTPADETSSTYTGAQQGSIVAVEGDVRSTPNDGVYDYTETCVSGQSALKITTRALRADWHPTSDEHQCMTYLKSDTRPSASNQLLTNVTPLALPERPEDVPAITAGYDCHYIGSDQFSQFYSAHDHTRAGDASEEPFYADEQIRLYMDGVGYSVFKSRNLLVPRLYLKHATVEVPQDGKAFPARYDSVQQFTLVNRKGELITTYCADQETDALKGYSYRVENLEDATYYSAAEAKKIHAIALKGYWGSSSGFGSLQALKSRLAEDGRFSSDEIAKITDGMAMTAMQYAIWTHSNVMSNIAFVNAYQVNTPKAGGIRAADKEAADLIFKLYFYLLDQKPLAETENTTQNTLINEKNFLRKISLQLHGKPMERAENQDEDETNDVYVGDLAFELKVKPDTARGDDLTMQIYDGEERVATARIAGTLQPGEIPLQPVSGNRYVLSDVCLKEGYEDIRFEMHGSQMVDEAAYLFTSELKAGVPSQTMIGIAQGRRNVHVSLDVEFSLDVDDEQLLKRHVWRTEGWPDIPSTGDPFRPVLWLSMACGAAAAAILMLRIPQKRRAN